MNIIYSQEPLPDKFSKSLFLAGGTLRNKDKQPADVQQLYRWRLEALKILESLGYDGVVFVPEFQEGGLDRTNVDLYTNQIDWEEQCLKASDRICFWVPRNMEYLPCLTTNVEFGAWAPSRKCILGTPKGAQHVSYLHYYAQQFGMRQFDSLMEMLSYVSEFLDDYAAERTGWARFIPSEIWKIPFVQENYKQLISQFAHEGIVNFEFKTLNGDKTRPLGYQVHIDTHEARPVSEVWLHEYVRFAHNAPKV